MSHHFKHELRRHAPMLLCWCVLLGLHLFLSGGLLPGGDSLQDVPVMRLAMLFDVVAAILPLLFVPLIVQGDAPLDEHAFWTTRPVRGKTLFASKLLLVVLFFIVLPLGVEMAIIGLRGGGSRMALMIPEFLLLRGTVTVLAFAAGTLAPRILHAVAVLLGFSFLAAACVLAFVLLGGADLMRTPRYVMPSRVLLFGVFASSGALLSALVMYRTQARRPAGLIVGSGVVLGILSLIAWPGDLLGFGKGVAKSTLSYRVDAPLEVSTFVESRTGKQNGSVALPIAVAGKPDAVALPVLFAKARIVPDAKPGMTLVARSTGVLNAMVAESRACAGALFPDYAFGAGRGHFLGETPDRISFFRRFEKAPLHALFESKGCDLTLEGSSGWFTFEIAGEIPLRKGAKWTDRGEAIRITRAAPQGDGFELAIETREFRLLFERERCAVGSSNSRPWGFVALHEGRKQAVWIHSDAYRSSRDSLGLSPLSGGLVTAHVVLHTEFGSPADPEAGQAWLDEARLMIIRPVFHGVVPWNAGPATVPLMRH